MTAIITEYHSEGNPSCYQTARNFPVWRRPNGSNIPMFVSGSRADHIHLTIAVLCGPFRQLRRWHTAIRQPACRLQRCLLLITQHTRTITH